MSLPDAALRVDDTKVLWERDSLISNVLKTSNYNYPQPDPQWIEDRFWVWTHYGATKIARGEYFEALEFMSFLRTTVLSPLALQHQNLTPSGVRRIEERLPEFSNRLKETVATHDKVSLIQAMASAIELYIELRENVSVEKNSSAEELCLSYFRKELLDG